MRFKKVLYERILLILFHPCKQYKIQIDQFKAETVTTLIYDKYYELVILSEITHDKELKWSARLSFKYFYNAYAIENFLMMKTKFHLTYNHIFVLLKYILPRNGQILQRLPNNVGRICFLTKV